MVFGLQKNTNKNLWGLLGDLEFELATVPKKFNFKESLNYAKHDRIEGKARLQYVGQDLNGLDLTFRFRTHWCDPDVQLKKLRSLKNSKKPQQLTLGTGTFGGYWVIEDLSVDLQQTNAKGETVQIEVSVKLLEDADWQNQIKKGKKAAPSPFLKRFRAK